MEISEFIAARLDEEERDARAAGSQYPDWTYDREVFTVASGGWKIAGSKVQGQRIVPLNDVDGVHIARQDPRATLARCAALRALVALHGPDETFEVQCRTCCVALSCETLHLIAATWAWHPDYRYGWGPVSPA